MALLLTCKLGLPWLCKPDGLALCLPHENATNAITNAIKGSASHMFHLRHSLVVKLGEEMKEQTEGKHNSPEASIADLVSL